MKVYQKIAKLLEARRNCGASANHEWFDIHTGKIEEIVKTLFPSGSGFDEGTKIEFNKTRKDRVVFVTGFHHMVEGTYDGWTHHSIVITPSLAHGFDIRVTGNNRRDIKDYIAEIFNDVLDSEYVGS